MARMSMSMQRKPDGESHLVCGVDLTTYRASPEWAEEEMMSKTRSILMTWINGCNGQWMPDWEPRDQWCLELGGPMIPPWTASHAHEWSTSNGQQQVPPLPSFGKKEEGYDLRSMGHRITTESSWRKMSSLSPLTTTSAEEWIRQDQRHGTSCS